MVESGTKHPLRRDKKTISETSSYHDDLSVTRAYFLFYELEIKAKMSLNRRIIYSFQVFKSISNKTLRT